MEILTFKSLPRHQVVDSNFVMAVNGEDDNRRLLPPFGFADFQS